MINRKSIHFFKLAVLVVAFLNARSLSAQGDPTLPEGFGINQLQTSENLSQGVLNINLPIENHLIPIGISYTTSGIRVNQRPGIVGLGWNLQAGGFISRQKRGLYDGDHYGYSGEVAKGGSIVVSPSESDFKQILDGEYDPEPDIYTFQFLGQSGRFTMDKDRNIIKLSANNLKIVPVYSTSSDEYTSFTITDDQGNKYLFSAYETINLKKGATLEESYRSKWYLVKITQYSTGEDIDLSYINAPTHTESSTFRWQKRNWSTGAAISSHSQLYNTEYYATKLLSEVSFNDTKVKFTYSDRDDISTLKKLDKITYTLNGNSQLHYKFNYRYMGTGSAERLMLGEVTKSSLDVVLYQFVYFGEADGEDILPPYDDDKQDHWGFYNNNLSATKYVFLGAGKSPYLDHAKANSLKKVYHTSGGFDEYEYELNNYKNSSGQEIAAGGLRISKVYKDDGENASNRYLAKTYTYLGSDNKTSGEIYAEPSYFNKYVDFGTDIKVHREYSLEPLMDDLGRHISYEYVKVTHIDGGSEKYKFFTFADDVSRFGTGNTDSEEVKSWRFDHDEYYSSVVEISTVGNEPFGKKNFKGTVVGLAEEVEVRDSTNNLLSKTTNTYINRINTAYARGMNFMAGADYDATKEIYEYWLSYYKLQYGYALLDQVTTTSYDASDVGKYLSTVTKMYYDANHPLEEKRETYRLGETSGKRIAETDYLFNESSPPTEVTNNNLLALVKQQTSLIDSDEKGKVVNSYATNTSTSKLELDNRKSYRKSGSTDILVGDMDYNYDSDGRLIGSTDQMTGFENCTILDDDGMRVMAEVSNSDISKSAFSSFEGDDTGGWTMPVLVYTDECNGLHEECEDWCDENNQPGSCYTQCDTDETNCLASVNLTSGIIGTNAFMLSKGNITKSLAFGDYILGYWYKSGTVSISGASSNTLLQSRTLSGWTFEERKINLASAGTLTISSSTAYIDHLRIHPYDASMSTYTYHPVFGKTSESDANNNSIFYVYDYSGRLDVIKDREKNVIKSNDYNIMEFIDLSATSFSTTYQGGSKEVFVTTNDTYWTASSNKSWATVSPSSGVGSGKITITVNSHTSSTPDEAEIKIENSLPDKTITVNRGGAPSTYLNVPASVTVGSSPNNVNIIVSSSHSWTASVVYDDNTGAITISPTSGNGSSNTLTVTCNNNCNGGNEAEVEFQTSYDTEYMTVYY